MVQSMIQYLNIQGLASNTRVKRIKIYYEIPAHLSLMEFLINNGITIASSCAGKGHCHKCIVNENVLSCQIKLKQFILNEVENTVEISYL